jgi:Flp pilus assembly protein TadD
VLAPPHPDDVTRQCLDRTGDAAVKACRQALALALPAARAATLRRVLAVELAALRRWDEIVVVYRESVRAHPSDPGAQQRLGRALFHLAGRPAEAVGPLQEAIRLRPGDAAAHCDLGLVLAALGRLDEAVEAFEEAARLDPDHFQGRPAARATFEAARRGHRWP